MAPRQPLSGAAGALEGSDRGDPARAASRTWLEGAESGLIRTRSGDAYKPSAVRAYRRALRLRVPLALAEKRLTEITRRDLQDLTDRPHAEGLNPSTIGVTMLPLRAIYRRALSRGEIAVNPTAGLELPKVQGGRDRIAEPKECMRPLEALPAADRPVWATARYAGLRRGELFALWIEDVDLAAGLIHVRRGWDRVHGEIATKSRGERKVPIAVVRATT